MAFELNKTEAVTFPQANVKPCVDPLRKDSHNLKEVENTPS